MRPGVWSIPVPIPVGSLRYTTTYLLEAGSGFLLVDTGWASDAGWESLVEGIAAAGASLSDIEGIVVTHVHLDHHGLTNRVREASGAWIAMHPLEAKALPSRIWATSEHFDEDLAWLRDLGVPSAEIPQLRMTPERVIDNLELPEPDRFLEDGDRLPIDRAMRAIWTPGHTPGHLCLYDETHQLMLSGDHVLPRISPNISQRPHRAHESPLADYLTALTRMRPYAHAEALPAHEYRFSGLAARVDALIAHHHERCAEIVHVLGDREDATTYDIAAQLHWSRGWEQMQGFNRRAGLGETAAHLQYLVERGEIYRLSPRSALNLATRFSCQSPMGSSLP